MEDIFEEEYMEEDENEGFLISDEYWSEKPRQDIRVGVCTIYSTPRHKYLE